MDNISLVLRAVQGMTTEDDARYITTVSDTAAIIDTASSPSSLRRPLLLPSSSLANCTPVSSLSLSHHLTTPTTSSPWWLSNKNSNTGSDGNSSRRSSNDDQNGSRDNIDSRVLKHIAKDDPRRLNHAPIMLSAAAVQSGSTVASTKYQHIQQQYSSTTSRLLCKSSNNFNYQKYNNLPNHSCASMEEEEDPALLLSTEPVDITAESVSPLSSVAPTSSLWFGEANKSKLFRNTDYTTNTNTVSGSKEGVAKMCCSNGKWVWKGNDYQWKSALPSPLTDNATTIRDSTVLILADRRVILNEPKGDCDHQQLRHHRQQQHQHLNTVHSTSHEETVLKQQQQQRRRDNSRPPHSLNEIIEIKNINKTSVACKDSVDYEYSSSNNILSKSASVLASNKSVTNMLVKVTASSTNSSSSNNNSVLTSRTSALIEKKTDNSMNIKKLMAATTSTINHHDNSDATVMKKNEKKNIVIVNMNSDKDDVDKQQSTPPFVDMKATMGSVLCDRTIISRNIEYISDTLYSNGDNEDSSNNNWRRKRKKLAASTMLHAL